MTRDEFISIQEEWALSNDEMALQLGLTTKMIEHYRSGTRAVSDRTERQIEVLKELRKQKN